MIGYKPCVEDGTAHVHKDGKFIPGSVFLCSMCRPTNEEMDEEFRKIQAYQKREALQYATRRPSKSLRLRVRRFFAPVVKLAKALALKAG